MRVHVLTGRPEEYYYLEELYDGAAQFVFSDEAAPVSTVGSGQPDIIIADPEAAGTEGGSAALFRRGMSMGRNFIVCAPGRKKSIIKELKAAGLVPGEHSGIDAHDREHGIQGAEAGAPVPQEKHMPDFRYVIGIVDMSRGAGAELLTLLLAEELASESLRDGSLVTVLAPDDPYFYNALSLGRRFEDRKFTDIRMPAETKEAGDAAAPVNVDEGISWAVAAPGAEADMDSAQRRALMEEVVGNFILVPYCGSGRPDEIEAAGESLDALILAVDPRPSAMLCGLEFLEFLQGSGIPVIYAVSRMNSGVRKNAVLDFLGTEDAVFVPFIDPAAVYAAEYRGENPYRDDEVRRAAMPSVCGITERIRRITGNT